MGSAWVEVSLDHGMEEEYQRRLHARGATTEELFIRDQLLQETILTQTIITSSRIKGTRKLNIFLSVHCLTRSSSLK